VPEEAVLTNESVGKPLGGSPNPQLVGRGMLPKNLTPLLALWTLSFSPSGFAFYLM